MPGSAEMQPGLVDTRERTQSNERKVHRMWYAIVYALPFTLLYTRSRTLQI